MPLRRSVMACVGHRCYSHDNVHRRHGQERTELVSALVLVPALALASASALVLVPALALASASELVSGLCHH